MRPGRASPDMFVGGVFDLPRPLSVISLMDCGISLLNISDRKTEEYVRFASSAGDHQHITLPQSTYPLTLLGV